MFLILLCLNFLIVVSLQNKITSRKPFRKVKGSGFLTINLNHLLIALSFPIIYAGWDCLFYLSLPVIFNNGLSCAPVTGNTCLEKRINVACTCNKR